MWVPNPNEPMTINPKDGEDMKGDDVTWKMLRMEKRVKDTTSIQVSQVVSLLGP